MWIEYVAFRIAFFLGPLMYHTVVIVMKVIGFFAKLMQGFSVLAGGRQERYIHDKVYFKQNKQMETTKFVFFS